MAGWYRVSALAYPRSMKQVTAVSLCAPASGRTVIVFLEALLMTKQKGMGQDGTWLVSILSATLLTLLPSQEGSLRKAKHSIVTPG